MDRMKKYNDFILELYNRDYLSKKEKKILDFAKKINKLKKQENKTDDIDIKVALRIQRYEKKFDLINLIQEYWEIEESMSA